MAHASSTFVLRLWTAGEAPTDSRMLRRGRLDHLQSGDHVYFDHLPEALTFIRQHFGDYDDLLRTSPTPRLEPGNMPHIAATREDCT
jgi:hypothetical protein